METANAGFREEVIPLSEKIIIGAFVVVPFLAFLAAPVILYYLGFSSLELWTAYGVMFVMAMLSGMGVTAGFHRLFTHRAFETVRAVKIALGISGSMSFEGPLIVWCARHGRHHTYSDEDGDPHSPHLYGKGFWAIFKGFLHAHTIWLFRVGNPVGDQYVRHLRNDPDIVWVNKLFPLWSLSSLVVPPLLAWLITGTLSGLFLGALANVVRIFYVHHVTWSINSVCHLWGQRPFPTSDKSRNNWIFGILGWGEGWHNNHHAGLRWARHGLYWWQPDITWYFIKFLIVLGLAWNPVLPTAEEIEKAMRRKAA